MDEQLAERFFKEGVPENIKDRVLDILILPNFGSHDEALKIRLILDELIPSSLIVSDKSLPKVFEEHPVEVFDEEAPVRIPKSNR